MLREGSTSEQITTLTLVRYSSISAKFWAFRMMRNGHSFLSEVKGMNFYKLMGSGRGLGFSPLPDWSVYSLLQVWETEVAALDFMASSPLISLYDIHGSERVSFFMKNISSRGEWSNFHPFQVSASLSEQKLPVAILTRATIKFKHLIRFWKYVPIAQKPIPKAEGLIYTKGIGETPVKEMATFSIWDNLESVKQYAYNRPEHAKAIRLTRKYGWFSEELFARFQLYKMLGGWEEMTSLKEMRSL
jgi:hypothetical protein